MLTALSRNTLPSLRVASWALAARGAPVSSLMTLSQKPNDKFPLLDTRVARMERVMKLLARNSATQAVPHSHATHFKVERLWAVGMLPLFPAALFIHNPVMDYALAVAITMHIHWGLYAVMQDYARPFLLGETLAKTARGFIYVLSVLMFAGLLHFNYNDVGITKAFELIWSL